MTRWILAFALAFAALTIIRADRLTSLPPDIASQAQTAAFHYAWAATNERMGPKSDVSHDKLRAQGAIDEMKKLAKGLISEWLVDEFKWMAFNAGWHAANERYHIHPDANKDKKRMDGHHDNLLKSGVFDESLVTNLKQMCFRVSWYTANTRAAHHSDAKNDKAYYEHHAEQIKGEVKVLSVDFDTLAAKKMSEKPEVIAEQTLDNSCARCKTEQSMSFSFSQDVGRTKSISNTVGFQVSVMEKIEAGFIFGGTEVQVSFEMAYSHTWGSESSVHNTRSYNFPVNVPARSIYKAKATVHQVEMDVPYTMKMAIGNSQWTSSGTWRGIAVSQAAMKIEDVTLSEL